MCRVRACVGEYTLEELKKLDARAKFRKHNTPIQPLTDGSMDDRTVARSAVYSFLFFYYLLFRLCVFIYLFLFPSGSPIVPDSDARRGL